MENIKILEKQKKICLLPKKRSVRVSTKLYLAVTFTLPFLLSGFDKLVLQNESMSTTSICVYTAISFVCSEFLYYKMLKNRKFFKSRKRRVEKNERDIFFGV